MEVPQELRVRKYGSGLCSLWRNLLFNTARSDHTRDVPDSIEYI